MLAHAHRKQKKECWVKLVCACANFFHFFYLNYRGFTKTSSYTFYTFKNQHHTKMAGRIGKITTSFDRSKAELMPYLLILNEDYSELNEEDKTLSERLSGNQINPYNFMTLKRRNGTELFHTVATKNDENGSLEVDDNYNKILDICSRSGITSICIPDRPMNVNFFRAIRSSFGVKGIDVTVLLRGERKTIIDHSNDLRQQRENLKTRMRNEMETASRIRHRRNVQSPLSFEHFVLQTEANNNNDNKRKLQYDDDNNESSTPKIRRCSSQPISIPGRTIVTEQSVVRQLNFDTPMSSSEE